MNAAKEVGGKPSMKQEVLYYDAGVDYFTGTFTQRKSLEKLQPILEKIARGQVRSGVESRPWGMSGYKGLAFGEMQFGFAGSSLLVRLSSGTAHAYWKPFFQESSNCSRLDVQVTVSYGLPASTMIRNHYREVLRFRRGKEKAPALSIFREADGPSTIYLGKRISNRFGRIYDKGAESGLDHYEKAVRYEVELKRDLAGCAASTLVSSADEGKASVDLVRQYFVDRGVVLSWPNCSGLRLCRPRSIKTADRSLRWLADSVRGTVELLCELGYTEETLAALGLDRPLGQFTTVRPTGPSPLPLEPL